MYVQIVIERYDRFLVHLLYLKPGHFMNIETMSSCTSRPGSYILSQSILFLSQLYSPRIVAYRAIKATELLSNSKSFKTLEKALLDFIQACRLHMRKSMGKRTNKSDN